MQMNKLLTKGLVFGIILLFIGVSFTSITSKSINKKSEVKNSSEFPLETDSGLVYSAVFGGTSNENIQDITVDSDGYIYVIGTTLSSDFPTTPDAYDTTFNGYDDVFVMKLSPLGDMLVYSTFLGGTDADYGNCIAIDTNGYAYILGTTWSSDFPTTPDAYDTTYNGDADVFVAKLSPSGDALVYSTFLGGTSDDNGNSIAVDTNGYAYITGTTWSSDFPTTPGAYDTTYNGFCDVFVSKLSLSGDALVYSTFLGGIDGDYGSSISIATDGCAYITGETFFGDFPTTPGAYDTTFNGSADAFVTKLSPLGDALVYSTFLGGYEFDWGSSIAVDTNGYAYILGTTLSSDFPTTPGAYDTTYNGGPDAFVTKLSPSGDALVYSTFLGGTSDDNSITVDTNGYAYITGTTWSSDFPTTPGAYDTTYNGDADVFGTEFSPSGDALVYSTFFGGIGGDYGNSIAVDINGYAYIVGPTDSTDFPTTPGAYHSPYYGNGDVFVAKFNPNNLPNNRPATPSSPYGPEKGFVGVEYTFMSATNDPDGDPVFCLFSWGDGTNSNWLGPYNSGSFANASHAWSSVGDYEIKVKAKDANGAESDWSQGHVITIIEGPILKIQNITGGLFKIKTSIKNIGDTMATKINWSITVAGGAIIGKKTGGNILSLSVSGERVIASKFIFGFGKTVIKVTAMCPHSTDTKSQDAKILLFFIKI
jgi:hypothetical protein